jgi:hypothetical protein
MAYKPHHPQTVDLNGVRLRPLRREDAGALYAYLRDPVVTERPAIRRYRYSGIAAVC